MFFKKYYTLKVCSENSAGFRKTCLESLKKETILPQIIVFKFSLQVTECITDLSTKRNPNYFQDLFNSFEKNHQVWNSMLRNTTVHYISNHLFPYTSFD